MVSFVDGEHVHGGAAVQGQPRAQGRRKGDGRALPERQDIFIHTPAVLMETLYSGSNGAVVEVLPLFFRVQR